MARTPSKYSPEFLKPWKPENNSGCCQGGCRHTPPEPVAVRRLGCSVTYLTTCGIRYTGGNRTVTWKSC